MHQGIHIILNTSLILTILLLVVYISVSDIQPTCQLFSLHDHR